MKYVLHNPISKNGNNGAKVKELISKLNEEVLEINVLETEKYLKVLSNLTKDDSLYLVGGDGTLNHFVNDIKNIDISCDIYFYTAGTGNDFYNDVKKEDSNGLVKINDYIKNLPTVIVNDKESVFIDGVGYGIDGYCCEVGDKLQEKSTKPVNYTSIAIKGLLFHYKPANATITIDGVTRKYKKVWLAPTMKGRFYGGGMMVAPNQNRLDEDNILTNVVMHKSGKLKTLMVFPSIFKGEHVKHTKYVDVIKGKHIIVEFDRPTALQIDGETVVGVTRYEVKA